MNIKYRVLHTTKKAIWLVKIYTSTIYKYDKEPISQTHRQYLFRTFLKLVALEGQSVDSWSRDSILSLSGMASRSHDTYAVPDNKVHGANMGPIWGRQDPGGPHGGPMNFVIWGGIMRGIWDSYIWPYLDSKSHESHLFQRDK